MIYERPRVLVIDTTPDALLKISRCSPQEIRQLMEEKIYKIMITVYSGTSTFIVDVKFLWNCHR